MPVAGVHRPSAWPNTGPRLRCSIEPRRFIATFIPSSDRKGLLVSPATHQTFQISSAGPIHLPFDRENRFSWSAAATC